MNLLDTSAPRTQCPALRPGAIALHAADDFADGYAHLRQEHPLYHDPTLDLWVVSRHSDVDEVLRDRHGIFTPASSYDPIQHLSQRALAVFETIGLVPVTASMDPPVHTRFRNALTAVWPTTESQLEPWHSHIEACSTAAATVLAQRPARIGDLTTDFARPLAAKIMGDMMGIDNRDQHHVITGSAAMADLLWALQDADDQHACALALADMWNYCTTLIAHRRAQPRKDFVTAWLHHRDEHGWSLTDAEIASTLMELLSTNAETMPLLINTTLFHLLDTGSYQDLVHHPEEITAAVEETLRHDPPLIGWLRTTTRPTILAGTRLPPGARLLLLMHSAAHDEQHTTANPDTFDHRRSDIPPTLNFGAGIHYCPGALYARLVTRHAIAALIQAIPDMSLAASTPSPRPPNLILRGTRDLTVTW